MYPDGELSEFPHPRSGFKFVYVAVPNDVASGWRCEMAADHQHRLISEFREKIRSRLQRLFGIEIERAVPMGPSHLARVVDEVTRYNSVFTLR
jgi:hypothetical protein